MSSMGICHCLRGIRNVCQAFLRASCITHFTTISKSKTRVHTVRRDSCVQRNQNGTGRNLGIVALAWCKHRVQEHGELWRRVIQCGRSYDPAQFNANKGVRCRCAQHSLVHGCYLCAFYLGFQNYEDSWNMRHKVITRQVALGIFLWLFRSHWNALSQDGWTPIFEAACSGNVEIAAILLKFGAKINRSCNVCAGYKTPESTNVRMPCVLCDDAPPVCRTSKHHYFTPWKVNVWRWWNYCFKMVQTKIFKLRWWIYKSGCTIDTFGVDLACVVWRDILHIWMSRKCVYIRVSLVNLK